MKDLDAMTLEQVKVWLYSRMTGDMLKAEATGDLERLVSILDHWQKMAAAELAERAKRGDTP